MIEIKIYHLDELIDFIINDEDSTHVCIMKDGEDILGIAGIKYVQEEIELIFTEMRVEDKFLFDGLIKTIVNYAFTKNFLDLVVYDEETISYLKEKDISINNNSINIEEYQNKTHCRKI